MTVIQFDQKKWNEMRFLQDDLKFMKRKNEDGKWDAALDRESQMLRDARRQYAGIAA